MQLQLWDNNAPKVLSHMGGRFHEQLPRMPSGNNFLKTCAVYIPEVRANAADAQRSWFLTIGEADRVGVEHFTITIFVPRRRWIVWWKTNDCSMSRVAFCYKLRHITLKNTSFSCFSQKIPIYPLWSLWTLDLILAFVSQVSSFVLTYLQRYKRWLPVTR